MESSPISSSDRRNFCNCRHCRHCCHHHCQYCDPCDCCEWSSELQILIARFRTTQRSSFNLVKTTACVVTIPPYPSVFFLHSLVDCRLCAGADGSAVTPTQTCVPFGLFLPKQLASACFFHCRASPKKQPHNFGRRVRYTPDEVRWQNSTPSSLRFIVHCNLFGPAQSVAKEWFDIFHGRNDATI